ncbi:proline-, glutamic acid- and leucine-rich protein 1-like [Apis cerana]|uniref:proline-, glutamic acid- and leucine-rich protein 1-like n=1 Tax=Apis cerana TaxID=7461 RepID=UPI002B235D10|nr:proline-, glutamic acid- and leucine-rich protein 1-like [Apis cerana]
MSTPVRKNGGSHMTEDDTTVPTYNKFDVSYPMYGIDELEDYEEGQIDEESEKEKIDEESPEWDAEEKYEEKYEKKIEEEEEEVEHEEEDVEEEEVEEEEEEEEEEEKEEEIISLTVSEKTEEEVAPEPVESDRVFPEIPVEVRINLSFSLILPVELLFLTTFVIH